MTPYDLPLPNVDPLPPAHPARRAAVIVTPGTITYLLSIPWLVMQTLPPEKHRWLVTLCAEEPGNIRALGDFDVPVSAGLEALDDADTVLMPHWTDPGKVPSPALIGALQKAADAERKWQDYASARTRSPTPAFSTATGPSPTGGSRGTSGHGSPAWSLIPKRFISMTGTG